MAALYDATISPSTISQYYTTTVTVTLTTIGATFSSSQVYILFGPSIANTSISSFTVGNNTSSLSFSLGVGKTGTFSGLYVSSINASGVSTYFTNSLSNSLTVDATSSSLFSTYYLNINYSGSTVLNKLVYVEKSSNTITYIEEDDKFSLLLVNTTGDITPIDNNYSTGSPTIFAYQDPNLLGTAGYNYYQLTSISVKPSATVLLNFYDYTGMYLSQINVTYTFTSTTSTTEQSSQNIVCFLEGTQILTPKGFKDIKILKEGDNVLTGDNRVVPIVNKKHFSCGSTKNTAPYIIPKDTVIGKHKCVKDLYLSPDHCVTVDETNMKPVKFLQFKQDKIDTSKKLKYYHIGLPNFFTDNLIANGISCESYGIFFYSSVKDISNPKCLFNNYLTKKTIHSDGFRKMLTTEKYDDMYENFFGVFKSQQEIKNKKLNLRL